MTTTTHQAASGRSEAIVASRFDLLESRFRAEIDPDDFRLDALLRHLGPIADRLVLDLGCGKRRFSRRLAAMGASVIGIDASPSMIRGAGAGAPPAAIGSALRLPIADGSIDAVVLVEVIEHLGVPELARTIAEARRVLKGGGRIAIVDKSASALDPNRPWLPAVLVKRIDEYRGRWMYPAGSTVRERWLWPGQVPAALRDAGFVGVRTERLLSPIEARSLVFRRLARARRFVAWSASVPMGGADAA